MPEPADHIRARYGEPENPDYQFFQRALKEQPFADLVGSISHLVTVQDHTFPDDDVSFVYELWNENTDHVWFLYLSAVGPYALWYRLSPGETGGPMVVRRSDVLTVDSMYVDLEPEIFEHLQNAGFQLMSADQVESATRFNLVNYDGDPPLYNVLFRDDEIPWDS